MIKTLLIAVAVAAVAMAVFYPSMVKAVAVKAHGILFNYMTNTGLVLGANEFSKEEVVAFEQALEGFNDALVLSRNVAKFNLDSQQAERSGDTIWRPQPYIAQSADGTDASGDFKEAVQLSVPARLGYSKRSTAILSATELRDKLQEGSLGKAAMQKLASDINVAVMTVAANYGSLVVPRSAAATGFDDVALCEAIMNEQGIGALDRYLALSTRDYNGMAGNLASRQTVQGKVQTAYEQAYVGRLASFETYKLDYANRIAAAAGGAGLTIDTRTAAGNYYVPKATSVGADGEVGNVDNRFQTITISSTTNVAAGDAFTIANNNACHHITKGDTGQLKTYRVVSVPSATTLVICPPIISGQGGSDAEASYQNCIMTEAAAAAIVFKNIAAASINPFWHKDAIELMPGRYAVPTDAGAAVMSATTDQGVPVVMQKQYDINTMKTKYRWDIKFGATNLNPEMTGILLFSQA